jgi:ElaB/YqjD/DUF883 family membrane-anchored ribosome-binding protein
LIERARRRLKLPLACVLMGMRGPQDKAAAPGALGSVGQLAADDQQKAEITKIVEAVNELVKATDPPKDDESSLQASSGLDVILKQVRDKTRELEKLLPNVAQEVVKPTADEALPGASLPGGDAGAAKPAGDAGPAKEPAKNG